MRLLLPALLALVAACAPDADPAPAAGDPAAAIPGAAATAGAADTLDPRVAAADSGRILGAADAPVWIIDVSDFQCPFCRTWHERHFADVRRELVETGQARFAYVNLPLRQHQHARAAATYAMCAGAQGQFFPYATRLYETQERWTPLDTTAAAAAFDSLAAATPGIDRAALGACVASGVMAPLIEADYQRALAAGVQSTPTFIVGGERLEGVQSVESLRAAVERARAAAAGTPAGSAAPASASASR